MSLSVIIIPVDGNADAAPPSLPPYVSKIEYYEIEFDNFLGFFLSYTPYTLLQFLPLSSLLECARIVASSPRGVPSLVQFNSVTA